MSSFGLGSTKDETISILQKSLSQHNTVNTAAAAATTAATAATATTADEQPLAVSVATPVLHKARCGGIGDEQ